MNKYDWLKPEQGTGEPLYDLLAAIVLLAMRDAKRGDRRARRWVKRFLDSK